ncbi:MAG TPA: NAD(P)-dependent oxidoreductase [Opitutaceae bacterium]|jgi:uronate dehydrogenase|nr:NAD(P)-dependent oxidoreductase [Opitutaceae bacterium]
MNISDNHFSWVTPAISSSDTRHQTSRTILITGASGYLGGVLREGLRDSFRIRLTDRVPLTMPLSGSEEFHLAELSDLDALDAAMKGVDVVVHLGGNLQDGPWDAILPDNIVGTYNVFECARRQKVQRVVFASSHHVVGYYRREQRIGADEPVRPDSFYAVSKVAGEALGRLYADKHGLSVICQRIGVARQRPPHRRSLSNWVSERDYLELTRCCIEAPEVHFLVVFGVSAGSESFYDNSGAELIGFKARDNADSYRAEVSSVVSAAEAPVAKLFQGGAFCAASFDGDTDAID